MLSEEFIELVQQMRSAQKEFFRTKSTTALTVAKRLERNVDLALRRLNGEQKEFF